MKKMWIRLKAGSDPKNLQSQLAELGRVELDPQDAQRLIITFHNQSEQGIRMAGFRLSQDFIKYFEDFDMFTES